MGQSRTENILENILGGSNPLPAAQSREEALLKQILEQGGGGGGHEPFVVVITFDFVNVTATADKTFAEIQQAYENGERLFYIRIEPLEYLPESGQLNPTLIASLGFSVDANGNPTFASLQAIEYLVDITNDGSNISCAKVEFDISSDGVSVIPTLWENTK